VQAAGLDLTAKSCQLSHLHARQLAQHVALAHLPEHFSHLRVLAEQIVHFLHRPA
jgi:hypothetical protein